MMAVFSWQNVASARLDLFSTKSVRRDDQVLQHRIFHCHSHITSNDNMLSYFYLGGTGLASPARLYISVVSYAQRVWSARNYKGLEDIELIAINLRDKPKWYLERVYPVGKVPALEHDGKVKGESSDLLEYIEQNFAGPTLFPKGSGKEEAAKDLLKFSDEFIKEVFTAFRNKEAKTAYAEEHIGPLLYHLETALGKFENDGPFFLGEFSAVDLAYAPFFERFEPLAPELLEYDIFKGRPRVAKWFEAINKVDAFTCTKSEPESLAAGLKQHLGR